MSEQELKKCKKCGSEALIDSIEHQLYEGYFSYIVVCKSLKCINSTDCYESEREAIEAWNKN